eukprot:14580504-Alexandrium_andersonii.AAC.1
MREHLIAARIRFHGRPPVLRKVRQTLQLALAALTAATTAATTALLMHGKGTGARSRRPAG